MNKSILLICYSFPPNKGIGGRRWAKFAKHLADNGYEIHVICKQPGQNEKSEWTQDTSSPNIILHPLPSRYPHILSLIPISFIQKLEYRIWLILFKFLSKGTFPERTFFWKNQLINKASELINQKKIKNLIVTVPPFRLGYYTSFLKLKFPELNFILDYRDPWTDNRTFHGFMNLSPARMKHELKMEIDALNRADFVFSTTEQMTSWLKEKVGNTGSHFITIPNGYDTADVAPSFEKKEKTDSIYRFIYAGTFYSNLEYILIPFLDALKKQESNTMFSKRFQFDFYGDMDPKMKNLFQQYALNTVHLHNPVPLKVIQSKIQESDFCMLFAAHDHAFNFNTKFYEYLANHKPILIFSKSGEVPDFLEKNKLGVSIHFERVERDFANFTTQLLDNKLEFDYSFDTIPFSTKFHAEIVMKQLK